MDRSKHPWKVEAVEKRVGTGTHVTLHATLDSAKRMRDVRRAEHGIVSISIYNGGTQWSHESSEPQSSTSS